MSVALLFMMGSLIMLVPFANLNIFSNTAMAQGYDNYGDSSSYSKYPTEDNKYECKTGPLEGFFVSSVEFCKFKFDDRKDNNRDNRTGTQGPRGPQGPPGQEGPSVLNNTRFYIEQGTPGNSSSTAFCDPEDSATGAGYEKSSGMDIIARWVHLPDETAGL